MGAQVTVLDTSLRRLKELDLQFGNRLNTVYATYTAIEKYALEADLLIGAVLIPGATAPKLVTHGLVKKMRAGTVLVDVAIDQGGCFETSRPTTHDKPTFMLEGVIHYCVTNMPGAVPRTSTFALNNATLPFVLQLANQGPIAALLANPHLNKGLNIHRGHITHAGVAEAFGMEYHTVEKVLA